MTPPAQTLVRVGVTGAPGEPPDDPPGRAGADTGGPSLVRLTVNLTRRSHRTLLALSEATRLGKTDVVNRAIQISALVNEFVDRGGGHLTVVHRYGQHERIYLLSEVVLPATGRTPAGMTFRLPRPADPGEENHYAGN